ncbi:MAG: elongation factor P [Candidatus Kerfeldbacteria bacterium CG_4_10_14_0_8_um_filter_42_10]|uniref:Elongation factor P n=1 Tax=Candidatus Kerfeldbacteria bacterium CG_4_10_14_0_8_um_filter_42_10 TaxID=2014248 RepID=A0A2M7RI19_9BACT|nr:MAG: elongation factor P [Candidatus Kerfeldbacteria bacterium CG_4_10_14_0_8_um_filter_42_10]
MLTMNDLKIDTVIVLDGDPFVVQTTQHVQMGRGGAILRTKLKNLISGNVLEKTFKSGDKIEAAELSRTKANFLYKEGSNFNFMDNQSFEQFVLPQDQIGEISHYVKEGSDVEILNFKEKPVTVNLPPKVELKVASAPPGVRGNTAQGNVTKPAILETGHTVQVPLFVEIGDLVRINTETGEYVERA